MLDAGRPSQSESQKGKKELRAIQYIVIYETWKSSYHILQPSPYAGQTDQSYVKQIYFWFKYDLGAEVLCTPSSTQPGFELMTSRWWQCI